MVSSRRSSLSTAGSNPPPYSAIRTRPPSFQSSPPRSIRDLDPDVISVQAEATTQQSSYPDVRRPGKTYDKGLLRKKTTKAKALKPIPEKPEPDNVFHAPTTRSRDSHRCCGCGWSCFCFANRPKPCFLASVVLIVMVIVAGVVVPVVVLTLNGHHGTAAGNSTVIATITSVVSSTQVVSSTSILQSTTVATAYSTIAPTTISSSTKPTSTFYLGGFDAVYISDQEHIFYTDQEGSIQHIMNGYEWEKANPNTIASDVKPGSPISASVVVGSSQADEAHVFYVDAGGTIQGVHGQMAYYLSDPDVWHTSSVGSLNLHVSDSMFIRTCVPDSTNYTYGANADLYLYFASRNEGIKKYGWWQDSNSTAGTWKQLNDLPPVQLVGEVECELASGFETLWTTNSQENIEQWWRSQVDSVGWTKGIQGQDRVYVHTSLLSLSSVETLRSHLVFQSADLDLMRYDINGVGSNATLDNIAVSYSGTPGTRLATWANFGFCGMNVEVFYQRSNTSELHYHSFQDTCEYSYTYDYYYRCDVTEGSDGDQVISLVKTYGHNVKHSRKFSGWAYFGMVVAGIVCLVILSSCCICCCD